MSDSSITGIGTYLPRCRLAREELARALGEPAGQGARTVASYDEDATSMAVEAGLRALGRTPPALLLYATTAPPYLDKANAAAVHAALALPDATPAYDMVGSVRSAVGALRAVADAARPGAPAMAVFGDVRIGLPGSVDERTGGDAGAAVVFGGEEPALAHVLGRHAATAEFTDRWRTPGDVASRLWEERFGETVYVPLGLGVLADALKQAGIRAEDVDHLVVTGPHARAVRAVVAQSGVRPEAVVDDLGSAVGFTGAAHPVLLLASALRRARPGELVVLLVLADGADAFVLRAGPGVADLGDRAVADPMAPGLEVTYQTFLRWRGLLAHEPPRRPDPDRPAAPPSARTRAWKFGFVAGRCGSCGTRQLPPARVCLSCGAVDEMAPERLVGVQGTVATFAVDRLAYSLSPPVVSAVVDFDGGGRLACELTDVDAGSIAVGDRVELTFRRLYTTADGVHNYFWKARPVVSPGEV